MIDGETIFNCKNSRQSHFFFHFIIVTGIQIAVTDTNSTSISFWVVHYTISHINREIGVWTRLKRWNKIGISVQSRYKSWFKWIFQWKIAMRSGFNFNWIDIHTNNHRHQDWYTSAMCLLLSAQCSIFHGGEWSVDIWISGLRRDHK